jgi:D-alanyl-D-alanine carboxypeptidase
METELIARLEDLQDRLIARRRIQHVVLGAASMDGSWSWTGATGQATPDGRPMTPDTPFQIASVTKLFITVHVLRLVEEGLLDLVTPIAAFLPTELSRRLHVHRGVDHTDQLTVAHLLGHHSGLPDALDERPPGGRSLVEQVVSDGDRAWTHRASVAVARDELRTHFPPSDPGDPRARIRYSDTNFQLLMVMLEEATGGSMDELHRGLAQERGLEHTWLPGSEPLAACAPPAAIWIGDRTLADRPMALRSFGDLYSTVDDLLSFGRALFAGRLFDDPDTLGLMQQRFHRFGFPRGLATLQAPSWPIEYGLGLMRFALSRPLAGGRHLPALLGHTGSTGSWLWWCPELDLLLAGTVDQTAAAPVPFRAVPRVLSGLTPRRPTADLSDPEPLAG